MRLSQAITRINYVLRGTDDDAPIASTDEYDYWVNTLNRKKDELYQDAGQTWSNTYEKRSFGTISASAEPSYDLDDDFLAPSDSVYVITTSGLRVDFPLVKPQEVDQNKQQVFIAGMNPQTLYFTKEILEDETIVGGTLYVPGYYIPADITSATAILPFPDPNWGVMATAAEIAFNDIVYETKAPDLNDKANALWKQMVRNNRRGTFANPRAVPTRVNRIVGPSRRSR